MRFGFVLALSCDRCNHRQCSTFELTADGPPLTARTSHAPRLTLHAPRHLPPDQRGQVVRGPSPAGDCLSTDPKLPKIQRSPISLTKPSLYFSPTRRFRRTNHSIPRNRSLATRQALPTTCPRVSSRWGSRPKRSNRRARRSIDAIEMSS
jgi:hypothetical protein